MRASNFGTGKKTEFSKKWLIGCAAFSCAVTITSYILAGLDKNPVSELSVAVIEACWGASGVSFIGYVLQNSVRAFTASKFGIPQDAPPKEDASALRRDIAAVLAKHAE